MERGGLGRTQATASASLRPRPSLSASVYVGVFLINHTATPPNSRFGNQAANVGGSTPPAPIALESCTSRRNTNVVARLTASPHAAPLRGLVIANGAPNSA